MTTNRSLSVGDVFETDIAMRWADADMLRHLNNTVYFRFMEEARIQLLASAGLRATDADGNVVAHCSCDFLRPITYPATIRVRLTVEKIGRSSLTHHNELFVLHDLAWGPYARGTSVLVNMDSEANRPTPWTPALLEALAQACRPAAS
jgi:acyl-CoA thioester hydrolase